MPEPMSKSMTVGLHMQRYLAEQPRTYQEAMVELSKYAPGYFEMDGGEMLLDWIENHTVKGE